MSGSFSISGSVCATTTDDTSRWSCSVETALALGPHVVWARAEDAVPLYLPRDTHWTPAGLRLAANVVAGRLRDLGWIETGTVRYDV